MGLETGEFIDDLNVSWPLGTDNRNTADDHLRLIKKCVQQSFPNISREVSATAGALNNIIRSDVTATANAILINEAQIVDGSIYARLESAERVSANWTYAVDQSYNDNVEILMGNSADSSLAFDGTNTVFDYDKQGAGTTGLVFKENGTERVAFKSGGSLPLIETEGGATYTGARATTDFQFHNDTNAGIGLQFGNLEVGLEIVADAQFIGFNTLTGSTAAARFDWSFEGTEAMRLTSAGLSLDDGTTFINASEFNQLDGGNLANKTADETVTGAWTFDNNDGIRTKGGVPKVTLLENDTSADESVWLFRAVSGKLRFDAVNDAENAANAFLEVSRTGNAIVSVDFPNGEVHINGSSSRFRRSGGNLELANTSGNFFIYSDAFSTSRFLFESTGTFHADNDVVANSTSVGSDPRLKNDIRRIESAIEKLSQLQGVTFSWKKNDEPSAGLLSTDVKKVLPEAVKEFNSMTDPGERYEHVNYNAVIGLLVEAVNTLSERVTILEG